MLSRYIAISTAHIQICHQRFFSNFLFFYIFRWVPGGSILETSDETWDLAMNLNLKGAFYMSQAFIGLSLGEKKPLAIVNMSSAASSIKGVPNRCAYSVSKGALIALTKSIAAV